MFGKLFGKFFVSRKQYNDLLVLNREQSMVIATLQSQVETLTKQTEIPQEVLEKVEEAVATSVDTNTDQDAIPFETADLVIGVENTIGNLKGCIEELKRPGANREGRKVLNERVSKTRESIKVLERIKKIAQPKKSTVRAKKSSKSRKSRRK